MLIKYYHYLAYAGALPFIVCAVLMAVDFPVIQTLGSYGHIALSYGLLIVSFMAGVHWGTAIFRTERFTQLLFMISNVIAITCWFAYLLSDEIWAIFVQVIAFAVLLWIDWRLYKISVIEQRYFHTRRNVTAIVLASQVMIVGMLV